MPEALIEQSVDRGALCEECGQWEYNEDGSVRTFMICGSCWNSRSALVHEVIEAARQWTTDHGSPQNRYRLRAAVLSLNTFEASQRRK